MTDSDILAGRVALVTGASRGIGRSAAIALSRQGARLLLVARGEAGLREAQAALAVPDSGKVYRCDLSDPAAIGRLVRDILESHGAPDILVNNAGSFALASVARTSVDAFTAALAVNLAGPFALVRGVLPAMLERGSGDIVTIGSVADRTIFPENAAYAASKHGLRAVHEALRMEIRGSGVRATLVSPGPVDTAIWDPIDPDSREGFTPRRDMLRPADVARAIAWVVSQPALVNVDELRLSHS